MQLGMKHCILTTVVLLTTGHFLGAYSSRYIKRLLYCEKKFMSSIGILQQANWGSGRTSQVLPLVCLCSGGQPVGGRSTPRVSSSMRSKRRPVGWTFRCHWVQQYMSSQL